MRIEVVVRPVMTNDKNHERQKRQMKSATFVSEKFSRSFV
jgi:hypothetical protein